jgi:hypothetical protein
VSEIRCNNNLYTYSEQIEGVIIRKKKERKKERKI